MKTPLLLGIITVLLFGSFALSGFLAEAGPDPNEITRELGNVIRPAWPSPNPLTSTAICPMTHKLIGGGIQAFEINNPALKPDSYSIFSDADFATNSWDVFVILFDNPDSFTLRAYAMCQKINFPMSMGSMIGGELLDIDTMSLFVRAIGVNPLITGLVAITMGGVAAQAIWFVNSRRVKKVE